ncbi:MAG: SpoIIE family protein phosphatase [Verrucomicrobia bacterium]|nr:SpoIIE family protein phosphatase [Verrucomicrobiota bacterium]
MNNHSPPPAAAMLPAERDVLLIDDEAFSRGILSRALEAAGFLCRQCGDGETGLMEIERRPPALLLLDLFMPEQDGAEFCARVRRNADPAVAQIPILIITGLSGEDQEVRCLEAGADDFISKPINLPVLKARLATHLRLRAMRQQLEQQNAELAEWRARLERDLEAARLTQQAIIPQRLPALPGWDVAAHYQPVIQVGGDVYDWLPLADGRLFFWIADATGHGAAAALLTSLTKLLFRHAAALSQSPSEILRLVNRDLFQIFKGRSLMTALGAVLDPRTGHLRVAGAGHPPLLVARADGTVDGVRSQVPPLGLVEDQAAHEDEVQVAPGETFLLITDGFYGLANADGDRLELSALRDFLAVAARDEGKASDLLAALVARVRAYGGRDGFPDDIAAVAVRRRR